jgi:nitrite reductase/ring-hydroxylating ferredoxin subunit
LRLTHHSRIADRTGKEVAMGLFMKVGSTQELEALEAGKLVEAAGHRIAIFNQGGKYWAIEDACPHRGGPLSEGMLAEDEVICPWHGSRFNLKTGAVLTPPAQRNVKSFPVRIVGMFARRRRAFVPECT